MKFLVFSSIILTLLFTNLFIPGTTNATRNNNSFIIENDSLLYTDTVFTDKDYFIEVDLTKQIAFLHSRKDSTFIFKVSTGNAKLEKGVDTKPGLYVIQSMMPKTYSKQFDSTVMLNWMGFNYGIGFHGLLGNSYYKYLGKKKSSHGCVRVARKDVELVYKKISIGTPVLVHNNDNILYVAFTKDSTTYTKPNAKELKQIIESGINSIYEGKYFFHLRNKIIINKDNVTHQGLPIGSRLKLPINLNNVKTQN